jgi:2'-hydroxyisoflavone reductase
MDILVIGGTKFVGRHLVEAALARGHTVTLFNRGQTAPGLFDAVQEIHGDRDGGIEALGNRGFDAVIDTSGYVPRVVAQSVNHFKDRTGRYLFVSSVSVYPDSAPTPVSEDTGLLELTEPDSEDVMKHYGALKAVCENVVTNGFGETATIVRPGIVIGPHDPTNRFTYWVTRISRGGTVLGPEPRDQPSQLMDARDLGAFMVDLIEHDVGGTFNATAPETARSLEGTLQIIKEATESDAHIEWVDARFLQEHEIEPWTRLPLWLPEEEGNSLMQADISAALGKGFAYRDLGDSAVDTLRWARGTEAPPGDAGLDPAHESMLLKEWATRSKSD